MLTKVGKFLRGLVDEAHEQAALGLFVTGIALELWTPFDDYATVAVLTLSCMTLFGSKRYEHAGKIPTVDLGGLGQYLPDAPEDELEDDAE